MKNSFIILMLCLSIKGQIAEGFIKINDFIPDIIIDLRYYSTDNFAGTRINGYHSDDLYLSKKAAIALKKVQDELTQFNLGLKVFDGYRPQQAVDHFVLWAKDLNDIKMKTKYYPNEDKSTLFKKGYIASKSGHSRGSTLDLTLVQYADNNKSFNELDMGTHWDMFSEKSSTLYDKLTGDQRKNRLTLKLIMEKHGFTNYSKEWWHYTLKNEPFPKTYFNFPIK